MSGRPYPDRFYPVVDDVAWVRRLVDLGVGTVQIRAKQLGREDATILITTALAAVRGSRTRLVVNDYWDAAIVAGAEHVHLADSMGALAHELHYADVSALYAAVGEGNVSAQAVVRRVVDMHGGTEGAQEDLAEADVGAIRKAGMTLGISTHDEDELEAALSHDPHYVALGPIYPTTLKAMRFGPQGLERIGEWKRRVGSIPLVAIGGITLELGPGVYAAGADSIAVVSDVTRHPDPDRRVRDWLDLAGRS